VPSVRVHVPLVFVSVHSMLQAQCLNGL